MKQYNDISEFDRDLLKFKNVTITEQESADSYEKIITTLKKNNKQKKANSFFKHSMAILTSACILVLAGWFLYELLKTSVHDTAEEPEIMDQSQGHQGQSTEVETKENPEMGLPDVITSCEEASFEDIPNTINVFFHCSEQEEFPLKPVQREIVNGAPVENKIEYALQQLTAGPATDEAEAGFYSIFTAETANALESVTLQEDGHLIVNFQAFIPNGNTSTGSLQMMDALNYTASQFEDVQTIEYQYNGSCQEFFDWLQVGECITYEADDYRTENLGSEG